MNKWKVLTTPKGFITCVVLFAVIWPSYYYFLKWKNEPVIFPETKPVVLDNGNTVYTLYHRDPRSGEVEIHPWTITLPSDAYVWREEAREGPSVRSIKINGVSLNTTTRPNSSIKIWFKWPEMEFLTVEEGDAIEQSGQHRYYDGIGSDGILRLSVRGILNTLKEDLIQSEVDSIKRRGKDLYLLDVSTLDDLKIKKIASNDELYTIIDREKNIILRCGKTSCDTDIYIKNFIKTVIYISPRNIVHIPHIRSRITDLLNNLVDVPETAKRTAW